MERITRKQVLALAETVSVKHPAPLDIQQLDVANGQAWRLFVLADYPASYGRYDYPGLDDGLLGGTNREAYQTLRGILAGMEAQRLAQAETVRQARQVIDRSLGQGWNDTFIADDLGGRLDALAPATEF